jgi:fibronectin type 3 domain-containing protein
MPKPFITQAIGEDKLVTLEWQSPPGRMGYTSFDVQRSDDGGKSFATRNSSPLINTFDEENISNLNFYIDTLSKNNKEYIYRVQGINPFGERSPYSDPISVAGKSKIGEMPHIVKHEFTEEGVKIEWEFDPAFEKLIKSFQVMRSLKDKEDFLPVSDLLSTSQREFTDPEPLPTAYYKIHAFGKNNEFVSSFPVLVQTIDSIPPEPPVELQAVIDSTGEVTLQWKANTEEDIYGYRIYRANSPDEEFSQLTNSPLPDTFYIDQVKLKTLSRNVYYRVMAIDKRQNHSGLSDILEVTRPDVVPPVPPVITNIYSSTKGVCLEWVHSSSSDVVSEVILRKSNESEDWVEIYSISDSATSYCDSLAETGKVYIYTLAAIDESGLRSEIEQKFSGKKQTARQNIELSYKINRHEENILLMWTPVHTEGKYIIYRGVTDATPMTYSVSENSDGTFTDVKVKPQESYTYVVKYIGNGTLVLSNSITVDY